MPLSDLINSNRFPHNRFRHFSDVRNELIALAERHADLGRYVQIGESEESRPIDAFVLGNGAKKISLIAGAHSDEPVGTETLSLLISELLDNPDAYRHYLEAYQFAVVPHINPDGEFRNRIWKDKWPDFPAYMQHAFRELPGRDLEFGFPNMRVENEAVAQFLKDFAPFHAHLSLHGMGFSEGAMFLIDKDNIAITEFFRDKVERFSRAEGLDMHDHDRHGEKGFIYIRSGFSSTPESEAMRKFFLEQNDPDTARLFHQTSMEYVKSLGGSPLCLVTELPLFEVKKRGEKVKLKGVPEAYLKLKSRLPEMKLRLERNETIDDLLDDFEIKSLPIATAVKIQLHTIELALKSVG
ncbi:peptidase M14 carboxypeptidase A [Chloroherpeton thalassium ATCC 35110]|uniref:Peptidase M14 carboxypeptidase A n=1 Tax=Chloroherpeton thalassium (strain ATCC 35110 / GB-78) TaxID=517418 RepID=B3QVF7_CHLT3|nr:M14 family zinc carboxypeptidase [Chloroherpeton thalassium]ACF14557.1 peptidase M14 carboxypeptidase A [Chloroherpeton thalassium ATCC 35110]